MQPRTSGFKEESSEKYGMVDLYENQCRSGDDSLSLRFTGTRGPLLSSRDLPTTEIIPGNAEETLERIEFS